MKPLSEWTEEDLIAELTHPRASGPHQSDRRAAALAELLRRERERCAKVCDDVKAVNCEYDTHGAELTADCLSRAAVVIRGLK